MQELRRIKRTQMFKHARIWLADSAAMIDCIVCDLTNSGAGLRVSAAEPIPTRFDLIFDSTHFTRRCEVRWKSTQCLGVEFSPNDLPKV
jgi:hypothetical protein